MAVRILVGDCREQLKTLDAQSVHCVVTSPPYWGLRDYGEDGQLGLEKTPEEHVAVMVDVFREVWRVLRDDGTCWVNYGDSYSGGGGFYPDAPSNTPEAMAKRGAPGAQVIGARIKGKPCPPGLKPKDLVGMPWRVAFALQADGWYLRSDIIWKKPNPMPESVTDRPTKAHEYVFLLTKKARYYYDADAVREAAEYGRRDWSCEQYKGGDIRVNHGKDGGSVTGANPASGRNLRTVWTIPTHPFTGAHFATFPPKLVEPCIKAGCPEGGTVLDPFGGAGTVGLVADRLQRDAVLCELNEEYAEMARKRISGDCPMFADVTVREGE